MGALWRKISSRKFLLAVAGIVSALAVNASANVKAYAVAISAGIYAIAEAIVDASQGRQ